MHDKIQSSVVLNGDFHIVNASGRSSMVNTRFRYRVDHNAKRHNAKRHNTKRHNAKRQHANRHNAKRHNTKSTSGQHEGFIVALMTKFFI